MIYIETRLNEYHENSSNSKPMSSKEWLRFISNNAFSKDELGRIYCVDIIWQGLLTDPENLSVITKRMLDRGMDPNQLVQDDFSGGNRYHIPLIDVTRGEDGSFGAESLKLLLEYGGDPNTIYEFGDFEENVFEFYVEDVFANAPDLQACTFYGILLCAGYGGNYRNGFNPITMLIDSPISLFKDYDLYWYEYMEDAPSSFYIIEKETGIRVARYH